MSDAIVRAQKELKEERDNHSRACQGLIKVVYKNRGISIEAARKHVVEQENLDEAIVQGGLWHVVNEKQIRLENDFTLRPYHNPRHQDAVALNDIEPGLKVELYYGARKVETLVIISEPFPKNTEGPYLERLRVMVTKIDRWGELVLQSEYLDELGIVPHERERDRWIEDYFTLIAQ